MSRSLVRATIEFLWAGFIFAGCLPSLTYAAQEIIWDEKYYNPKPAQDDFVLPMPCGGAMVFRPVVIAKSCCMSDRPVRILGAQDPELGYKEGSQMAYIAGSFNDGNDPNRRIYYISKYETTADQYAVWQGGSRKRSCPKPSLKGRKPVVGISWFDAVDFSRSYTEWLLQNVPDALPKEDSEPGYLRLPTEIEWEYAARGGEMVNKAEFVAPLEGEKLDEYVWSSRSSQGKLKPVGTKKSNQLNLFDMQGNAAEMLLGSFYLDHRGRRHGQAGGFVYRGGSVNTPLDKMRISERQEKSYFSNGNATKLSTVGFRLVLTAPVIVSHKRRNHLEKEWLELPEPNRVGSAAQVTKALHTMDKVVQQTENEKLRTALSASKRDLEKTIANLNEVQDRAVKALIRMGTFMAFTIDFNYRRVGNTEKRIDLQKGWLEEAISQLEILKQKAEEEMDPANKAKLLDSLKRSEKRLKRAQAVLKRGAANLAAVKNQFDTSAKYYSDLVIDVGEDYSEQDLAPQTGELRVEFREKQSEHFIRYADLFVSHIGDYRRFPARANSGRWVKDIVNRQRRVKQ